MSTNKYEEIIKEYLERECEKDIALKAAYKADAIHKCFAFITSQAKKIAVNNCAMVEDVKVYKWARDYYFDILPNEKEKKTAPENDELEEYNYDGYSIFVPQDVLTIEKQAKDLHQCLVYAGYIDKVINKKCLLVFVQKDGKSIATAELYPDNKLGQFYADELDRKNCRPTQEVKKAFNKWLENKIKLEAEQKKKSA